MEERGDIQSKPKANAMSLQSNDAAQSPSCDSPSIPPNPFTESSPPPPPTSSRHSHTVIDFLSPTRPEKRMRPPEEPAAAVRPPTSRDRRSEDEKRLFGDFSRPADAVSVPDPKNYLVKSSLRKPDAGSRFRPTNNFNGNSPVARSKPTTYSSKAQRSHLPPIGQAQHAGQLAYTELQESRKPSCIPASRVEHGRAAGATPGKRRKTEPVVDLVEDDDDDDVRVVTPPAPPLLDGTCHDIPLSARSSQSHMSVGSGSTVTGNKPSQPKSEFREADNMLRPHKKPRRQGPNRPQGDRAQSPFAGGTMSGGSVEATKAQDSIVINNHSSGQSASARQTMLQDLQQGGSDGYTMSRHFPNARINESIAARTVSDRPLAGEGTELRKSHRPAPKHADLAVDSNSEDELTMKPVDKKVNATSKAARAANSGVKRKDYMKSEGPGWPLIFARSYEYQERDTAFHANTPKLVLRYGTDGWCVKGYDAQENVVTRFDIRSQDVIKAQADDVGRIRLEGPRQEDGNRHIFDLEFAKTHDFQKFRDEFLTNTLLIHGKSQTREQNYMLALFGKTLPERNDKVGKSGLVNEPILESEHQLAKENGTSKTPLLDQLKQPPTGLTSRTTVTAASTRPSRLTRSAPTYDVDGFLDHQSVFKYSQEVGLGARWHKSLEYGQGRQRAIVNFDDLPRLDNDECLNDSLIDFYMIYLFKKLNVPADKVYFFNSFFFSRLTENSGRKTMDYKAVERWTSKIDVFSYNYIVIPINEQYHWYLAIICNVSKIERKPVFEDFDEDNSQAHNKSRERPATLADETEETVVPQTMSSPKLSTGTQDTRDEHEDNDVNLFEESLSLVDREDPGAEVQTELGTNQANSIPQSPEVEPTDAAQATANAKSMPASILSQTTTSSAKNKMRRKSAQPKRDPHQPVILILDSLPGVPRSGTVRALKDWLKAEGLAKRGMDAEIKERGYYPKATQIPTQSNFTDCGVYLLGYVEKFFHNPDEFKNKLLTGSMFAEEDWPELKPEDMRQTMREIIVDLHEKQELERKPKKAKKGMTKSTTSPAPPTQGLTNSESQDTSMERVPPSGPQHGKTQLDHTQRSEAEQSFPHVASQVQPTQPRLASPFEFDRKQAEGYARPFLEIVGKVSDSPPGQTSPIKPASITPRPGRTPKPSSVEVRIPIKIPQSHTSARSEQKTFARTARSQEELRQTRKTPQSLSPSKRQRPNADGAEVPAAKKQSPRRQSRDPNMASSAHNHNGSAPSMPIEIEDSQEAHPTVSRHFQQPQADSQAQRKPPSRSGRPKPSLRHSPSIEEVEGPLPKRKHRKSEEAFPGDALEDKLDEQDYERNRSRRATGPGLPSSLNPTEEADPDSAEEISQSTGRMQLDGANDDAVVRETPEPGRRSPDVQGWSKNDRLFL